MVTNLRPASLPASANGSGRSAGGRAAAFWQMLAPVHLGRGGLGLGTAGLWGAEPGRTGAGRCHGSSGGGSGVPGCPAGGTGAVPLCSVSLAQVCWPWAT